MRKNKKESEISGDQPGLSDMGEENSVVNECTFTVKHTRIAKGVAILLLLFHHLFYAKTRYELMKIRFWDSEGVPYIQPFAYMWGMVCVYLFLILSGYGLYKKLFGRTQPKTPANNHLEYTAGHRQMRADFLAILKTIALSLLKIMKNYWFAVVISVGAYLLLGNTYPGAGIWNKTAEFFLDFFGLSYTFGTYSMNGAWWYMSLVVFSYLFSPLFWMMTRYFPRLSGIISILIVLSRSLFKPYEGFILILYHVNIFWLGMLLAHFHIFDKCMSLVNRAKTWMLAVGGTGLIALLAAIRLNTGDTRICVLLSIGLILVPAALFDRWKAFGKIFGILGAYSGNMYFLHFFFYDSSFKRFLYWWKEPVLVYFTLVIVSLFISAVLVKVKEMKGMLVKGGGILVCIFCLYGMAGAARYFPNAIPVYLLYEADTSGTFNAENLTAESSDGKILLCWDKNEHADGYLIYRKTKDNDRVYVGMTYDCEYMDAEAEENEYNFYWVYPYNRKEELRGNSNEYVFAMVEEEGS